MPTPLDGAEKFVEMTHGRTRYFEKGTGTPCILLHGVGYTGGGTSWFRNIDTLAESYRVLAPDMLGWGTGDRVERHLAFPYLVEFVREFQDVLGIERSHLVGHSLGGWVSQVFAYESPDRVIKLALVASAGHDSHHIPPNLTNFQPPARQDIEQRMEATPGLTREEIDAWTEAEWQNINAPKAAESFRQMLEFMTFMEERDRYITPRRWSRIRPQTLIVSGSQDAGYPPEVGKRMAETMPNARQVVLEAGHMVPMEAAKELNDLLVEFLKS